MKKATTPYPFSKDTTILLKGIFSQMVFTIHLVRQFEGNLFFSYMQRNGWMIVSVYLFIAGYGLMTGLSKDRDSYLKNFLHLRMTRMVYPFFLASVLFFGLSAWNGSLDVPLMWHKWVIKGDPPLPYSWFMYVILVFYFLFYLVFKTVRSKPMGILILFVCSVGHIFLMQKLNFANVWYLSILGLTTGLAWKYGESAILRVMARYGRLVFFCLFVGVGFLFFVPKLSILSKCIGSILIPSLLVLLLYRYRMPGGKIVRFLGTISFEFYLVHGIVLYMLRGNQIYIQSDVLYILCVYGGSLAAAWGLNMLLRMPRVRPSNYRMPPCEVYEKLK